MVLLLRHCFTTVFARQMVNLTFAPKKIAQSPITDQGPTGRSKAAFYREVLMFPFYYYGARFVSLPFSSQFFRPVALPFT